MLSGYSVQSVVSVKGQTVVPKEVREALGIKEGTKLLWFVQNSKVIVRPLPDDPVAAAMGALKDFPLTTADLLAERRAERDREEAEFEEWARRWRSTS